MQYRSLDGFACNGVGELDCVGLKEAVFEYANRRTRQADTAL